MSYAIISLGGKQYRVQEGERLLVDRVPTEEGKTFHPEVLMIGGDGNVDLAPKVQVTAKVVGSQLGEKIRIGKYKAKKGYRRKTGFRAKLSQIEIETIGAKKAAAPKKTTRLSLKQRNTRTGWPAGKWPRPEPGLRSHEPLSHPKVAALGVALVTASSPATRAGRLRDRQRS